MEFCVLEFLLSLKYDRLIVNQLESKPAKNFQKIKVSPAYFSVFTVVPHSSDWTALPDISAYQIHQMIAKTATLY